MYDALIIILSRVSSAHNRDPVTHNRCMPTALNKPIIINLPYGLHARRDFKDALDGQVLESLKGKVEFSQLEQQTLRYVLAYPTVYVVYSRKSSAHSERREYTAYVGETNDIIPSPSAST